MIFKGCATAIITPLTSDGGAVDFDSFKKLIEFQIKNEVDAIVVLGTTGAPSTLSEVEREEVLRFAVKTVAGRIPVIAGAGSNSTQEAVENCKKYQQLGADALLCVTPYYNKCTQSGLVEHFSKIAEATTLPIILYNVPQRTGLNMLPKTVKELLKHKNIVALKEANSDIDQVAEVIKLCPSLDVYAGNDSMALPVMALGGKGVISVASNVVPKQMKGLCKAFFKKDLTRAQKIQLELLPLIRALFCETSPIPTHAALNLMGKCKQTLRLPLTPMEEKNRELLKKELENLKLI